MKTIIMIIAMLLLAGCDKEIQKVYVDVNGTEIPEKPRFKTFSREIECDSRGYAYYVEPIGGSSGNIIHTPMFINHAYGAYQVTCENIK